MSTVGKVLIVAQIGFSVLLMAFAAGVSSVQTNWKAKEKTAREELGKSKKSLEAVQSEMQKLRTLQAASEKNLKDAADKAGARPPPPRPKIASCRPGSHRRRPNSRTPGPKQRLPAKRPALAAMKR